MSPLGVLLIAIIFALPIAWLASEFRGSRALRISLGILSIGVTAACVWGLSGLLARFSFNAWYGGATSKLISTSIKHVEEGHVERVLDAWRGIELQYRPTYENRAHYDNLVAEATRQMNGDMRIESGSSWDVSALGKESWLGHWSDGHGYWIVINSLGQPFDIIQSAQPREKVHSVSISSDFSELSFKEGDQWLHTLTLKNQYEASYEWFDLGKGKVWETRPIYKLIHASDEQKQMPHRADPANGSRAPCSAGGSPSSTTATRP
ncbi:MAG: hypothetical protein ACPGVU_01565 [Limisphaerales bacterium]